MTGAQRSRMLPLFADNDRCHLALAQHEPDADAGLGVNYHRPIAAGSDIKTMAVRSGNGDWIVNGVKDCVANAPVAGLIAVAVKVPGQQSVAILIVPSDTPGLTMRAHEGAWRHGPCGEVTFKDCRVPADNLLADDAAEHFARDEASGRGSVLIQAVNLGIGRAAYEAALDYAKLRVQGGRAIVEHQAIGSKLAEIAIKLEVARAAVWRAAWASDHPDAYADRSLADLPLQTIAQVFTSQMMLEAAKDAAEVFGASPDTTCRCRNTSKTRACACTAAPATATPSCGLPRRWLAIGAHRRPRSRPNNSLFSLRRGCSWTSHKQRAAQLADDSAQIRRRGNPPNFACARCYTDGAAKPSTGTSVKKGSKLGFRTMAVPKEYGGQGTDFVTQALGHGGACPGRQRNFQDIQPELEVEPSDLRFLH